MARKKKNAQRKAEQEEAKIHTEKKTLRYDFTAVETHEMALKLAKDIAARNIEEETKKATAKTHAAVIEALEVSINTASQKITDGWEYRDVECEVFYNVPTDGIKTFKRKDTGSTFTDKMDDHEWNLFNIRKDDEPITEDADVEIVDDTEGVQNLLPAHVPEGNMDVANEINDRQEEDDFSNFPKPEDPDAYNPPINVR